MRVHRRRGIGFALIAGATLLVAAVACQLAPSPKPSEGESPSIDSPSLLPSPSLAALGSWTAAARLLTPRQLHTATLLPDGRVLIAGGENVTVPHGCGFGAGCLASAELFNPLRDDWAETGTMSIPRLTQTATLLPDGTVLVVGLGWDSRGGLASASAELYDPHAESWRPIAGPTQPRSGNTATLLRDGTVLISGGTGAGDLGQLATAERYDPRTGAWTNAGSLSASREGHTATLLADGKVLVVGGQVGPDVLASAEIFDPATGGWTLTSPMNFSRTLHTATLLPDGRVLVVGGVNRDEAPPAGEIYDPSSDTWNLTASLPNGRWHHTSTLLPSGRVLVAGGDLPEGTVDWEESAKSVLAFDSESEMWIRLAGMNYLHPGHTATLLPDGTVLVVGWAGYDAPSVEIFQP